MFTRTHFPLQVAMQITKQCVHAFMQTIAAVTEMTADMLLPLKTHLGALHCILPAIDAENKTTIPLLLHPASFLYCCCTHTENSSHQQQLYSYLYSDRHTYKPALQASQSVFDKHGNGLGPAEEGDRARSQIQAAQNALQGRQWQCDAADHAHGCEALSHRDA